MVVRTATCDVCDVGWDVCVLASSVKNAIFFINIYKTIYYVDLCIVRSIRKIAKSDYFIMSVRSSVRMKQLGSHLTDFDEI